MRRLVWVVFAAGSAACGSVTAVKMDAPAASGSDAAHDSDAKILDAMPDGTVSQGPVPQLLWTFEGNLNQSGNLTGYTMTGTGNSFTTGKFGMALLFGTGGYTQTPGMHTSITTYAQSTIAFWMKEPGNVASQAIWDCNNRGPSTPYGGMQFGLSSNTTSLCVSTTTNSFLGGSCNGFATPSANTWHHWIFRYDGTGTGAGQGGSVEVYVDDVLVHTRPNDAQNNPVWNPGAPDIMTLAGNGVALDDLRIYNQVFTVAEQCMYIVKGTWTGSACTLP